MLEFWLLFTDNETINYTGMTNFVSGIEHSLSNDKTVIVQVIVFVIPFLQDGFRIFLFR